MRLSAHIDYIKRVFGDVIDSLLEQACLGCGAKGPQLCMTCARNMPRTSQRCIGCRRTSPDGMTCKQCIPQWHVHRIFAATAYRNALAKKVIKALKYRFDRSLAGPLALRTLTALHGGRVPPNPLFVPVPLHKSRKRWRGFNQAALLAQAAADAGLFSYAEALIRTRNTSPQTKTPGRDERFEAMSGAFSVTGRANISNRHIVLVDDVCTTGATLNACAQALLAAGARSITALVIARV